MTITQEQFNEYPSDAVTAWLKLPDTTGYTFRDDFLLGYDENTGFYFFSWNVAGVSQPAISDILNSALTYQNVVDCYTQIWT